MKHNLFLSRLITGVFLHLFLSLPFLVFGQEKQDTTQVRTLLRNAQRLSMKNADSALFYAEEAKSIAQKIDDKVGFAKAIYNEALAYMMLDNYFAADTGYQKSIALFKELKDTKAQAVTLANWGLNYQNQAKYEKAVEVYVESLKLNQLLNDSLEIAKNYANLGIVYKRIGDFEKALGYYQEAKTILKAQKQMKFVALALNNIGIIYKDTDQFEEALSAFREALQILENDFDTNKNNIAGIYNGIASVYKQQNQFDSALINYQKARKIFIQANSKSGVAGTTINLANLYLEKNQLTEALNYAQEGYKSIKELQNSERLQTAHKTLADIYAAQSNFEKAFFHQKEYQTIRDSLFTEENKNELAKMAAKFDSQEKEFENQILEKDNQQKEIEIRKEKQFNRILMLFIGLIVLLLSGLAILFYQNQKKKLLLETKNNAIQTLLSELHHRVKNNLQIIGSLLSIQARRLEEPTAKHAIQDVQSRIRTMTLIHEKLYQTDLLTEVELDEYIIELQQFLFRLYQKENQIQAIITIPKVRINVDKAIPLGLILNEWITNSLKYAFPVSENKSVNIISISLQKKENQYSIIYQDNGIGMQKETQNNTIKSDTPTKKKKSMGTQLVASLVEQLNATQKEHFEEQGVCFELIIPS
ncbi:MAG: hypothetical protein COZ18_03145 [Flexibacter sp. CG_4_10_14_3_um_filter_32_15]|nr:MAG: hypothetical protein COZ18_03145 [Flexibacter sp. CG_4_10_14_3_um_filter_32_15]